MPYIEKRKRYGLDAHIDDLLSKMSDSPGELNYVITRIVLRWMVGKRCINYENIALVTGVLENVKQELYRRLASPYEDQKVEMTGDIIEYERASVRDFK